MMTKNKYHLQSVGYNVWSTYVQISVNATVIISVIVKLFVRFCLCACVQQIYECSRYIFAGWLAHSLVRTFTKKRLNSIKISSIYLQYNVIYSFKSSVFLSRFQAFQHTNNHLSAEHIHTNIYKQANRLYLYSQKKVQTEKIR